MTADGARHPASPRRGFSLIELMIAVMILGLGMVMVATVFPVSLDMTRETLQMQIANSAVETAVQTLKLRVPGLKADLDGDSGTVQGILAFPNALSRPELYGEPLGIENDAETDLTEVPLLTPSPFPLSGPIPLKTRAITEATFWDADVQSNPVTTDTTWVVPSQNLPPNYGAATYNSTGGIVVDRPPYIDMSASGLGLNNATTARLHLADRVYPPVSIETRFVYSSDTFDSRFPNFIDPTTNQQFTDLLTMNRYVAQVAAERRYAWNVIHARSSTYQTSHSFLCTIVVTHRGDLTARYARQSQLAFAGTSPGLPLAPGTDPNLAVPAAASETFDTLFPQAWLVAFNNIRPSSGTVECTNLVARLLPAGSFFVIAQNPPLFFGPGLIPPAGFEAGTPHKVIGNDLQPAAANAPATLQIARSAVVDTGPVAVWVFPPPIRNRSGAVFQPRSPVVGAFIREVTP